VEDVVMKRMLGFSALLLFLLPAALAAAHFQYLVPSDDMVMQGEVTTLVLDLVFGHPFEGEYMEMVRPREFGVAVRGRKQDLLGTISSMSVEGRQAWRAEYRIRRPGDYLFWVEPAPYFEPAEDSFIVHYTKVVVHALGMEEGWDRELGLKTEIVPLTRPYGLWTGNVFQGVVKAFGQPVPYAEVEVEYFADGGIEAPASPFITQVVRADANGVFTYACPREGWWAFAALTEDREKMTHTDGKKYPVEIGAVLWIRTHTMD
jgi:cobalt/nickel transport protein